MICVTVREKFGLIVAIANAGTGGGFVVPRGSDDEQAAMDQAMDDIDLVFFAVLGFSGCPSFSTCEQPCSVLQPCVRTVNQSSIPLNFCGLSQLATNCSLR